VREVLLLLPDNNNIPTVGLTSARATVFPPNATNQAVTWSSDDATIAFVDPTTGAVSGVGAGSTTIIATAQDGSNIIGAAAITVFVENTDVAVQSITVNLDNNSIPINGSTNATADVFPIDATNKTVTWSAEPQNLVFVDQNTGAITGLQQGTADIIATATDGSGILGRATINITAAKSGENDILVYEYPHISGSPVINPADHTVLIKVFRGTPRTTVAPKNIVVSDGASITPGTVSLDFTVPQIYQVQAENGVIQNWEVRITEDLDNAKEITRFTVNGVDAEILGTDIMITMPPGTDISAMLTPTIEHTGENINPQSGVPQNFTNQPQYYVRSGRDGSVVIYTVRIQVGN